MHSSAGSERRPLPELMDDPALGAAETERALADLDRVTRWSLGLGAVLRTLVPRLAAGPRRQRLLDLGSGSGLILARLADAANRRGVRLLAIASDRKLSHLLYARYRGRRQPKVVADARALPFRDGAFDWTLSTLLFHHFDEPTNREVLDQMRRLSRRGIAVVDLRRSPLARALFGPLAAALAMGPVARYDGRLSLAQAWTPGEVARLCRGLPVAELRRRFPFRFSLVLEAGD